MHPSELFRRKSLDQLCREVEEPEDRLKKVIGPIDVTALGIGGIIGAGIVARYASLVKLGDNLKPFVQSN